MECAEAFWGSLKICLPTVGNAVLGVPTAARRQFGTIFGLAPDGTPGTAFPTMHKRKNRVPFREPGDFLWTYQTSHIFWKAFIISSSVS